MPSVTPQPPASPEPPRPPYLSEGLWSRLLQGCMCNTEGWAAGSLKAGRDPSCGSPHSLTAARIEEWERRHCYHRNVWKLRLPSIRASNFLNTRFPQDPLQQHSSPKPLPLVPCLADPRQAHLDARKPHCPPRLCRFSGSCVHTVLAA